MQQTYTATSSGHGTQAAAANATRVGFRIVNMDPEALIYWGDGNVLSGLTAQANGGSPIAPNFGEVVIYGDTGQVNVICDSGSPLFSYTEWTS